MDLTNLNRDRKRRKSSLDLSTMVYGKVPPQAKDLEEAVLGAIMLEKNAFDTVAEILKPECFYVEGHQRIFRCYAKPGAEEPADRYSNGGGRAAKQGRAGNGRGRLLCDKAYEHSCFISQHSRPTRGSFFKNSFSEN